ncbi:beta-hydroxyacyl-ACP dehydratase [Helicobacter cinaedi]|uniref:beta-hydroxyacyl-ACP dehydratase n=1 Tax=Helicobacter cinaedi TaxID=213 RepID=UPI000CF10F7B|nr:beta-hydroxyacyl-ACP dehydratase [Helicobacter cinaedi]QOQ96704.1 beta-hydroxyacyl-ACP dehydratase [Helicobacter cinaedi]
MPLSFDAYELQHYQPNRYPFLLIDVVTECEPGQYAKGYKNLTNNEWYFPIHFEGSPNMPGCLQIEAMAQMLTVAITSLENLKGEIVHGYKHIATFHKEIKPGHRLDIDARVLSFKRGLCKGYVRGSVGEELACELETIILIPSIFNQFKPGGVR